MASCDKSRVLEAGPKASAKPTSNEFCVRFTSLLFSSTVSTTYAEPIHRSDSVEVVKHDFRQHRLQLTQSCGLSDARWADN